jgi:putative ABC transport system permease protein
MGIPLVAGRLFNAADDKKHEMAVIINQRAARKLFPGRPAVGRQIRIEYLQGADPWGRVVGVVGDVKYSADENEKAFELYYPNTQYHITAARIALRVSGDPSSYPAAVRRVLGRVASDTAMRDVRTLGQIVDDSTAMHRTWASLLGLFAALALFLSSVGLYGLMNGLVKQRESEIAIRMSVGATPRQAMLLTFREAGVLLATGIACGGLLALSGSRFLTTLVFGISIYDGSTYLLIIGILCVTAALACALPAYRASAVDPVRILRQ